MRPFSFIVYSPSDNGMLEEWWFGDLIMDGLVEVELMMPLNCIETKIHKNLMLVLIKKSSSSSYEKYKVILVLIKKSSSSSYEKYKVIRRPCLEGVQGEKKHKSMTRASPILANINTPFTLCRASITIIFICLCHKSSSDHGMLE
ncbi:hypothetical protein MTR_1g038520 [Medicago truncatula]|uniref:Uncharacterized protein n=1 Tax=Medicago truncatula TaxID=3880 RepID=G7IBE0_MEDTR|nr:hypothetical protein MTR_1g038520 [Medicago truncatula]